MVVWLVPAFTVLFYAAGILIEHADTNWSIGIRTPWTLSNEVVWKKPTNWALNYLKFQLL
ncbi:MAG: SdpI family protein [Candidatus Kerfeldbacteria bacterium]|nr:SdpI family protein [Candidatus Kerfeldbacteria bacterium]